MALSDQFLSITPDILDRVPHLMISKFPSSVDYDLNDKADEVMTTQMIKPFKFKPN